MSLDTGVKVTMTTWIVNVLTVVSTVVDITR